jgi:hypothetical protein
VQSQGCSLETNVLANQRDIQIFTHATEIYKLSSTYAHHSVNAPFISTRQMLNQAKPHNAIIETPNQYGPLHIFSTWYSFPPVIFVHKGRNLGMPPVLLHSYVIFVQSAPSTPSMFNRPVLFSPVMSLLSSDVSLVTMVSMSKGQHS